MEVHAFHEDVALIVNDECPGRRLQLAELLRDLSFVRTEAPPARAAVVRLSVCGSVKGHGLPPGGRLLLEANGLRAIAVGNGAYLSDGASLFHVDVQRACATAQLASSFETRSAQHRQRFWAFGLLKLLRRHGLFGLHAAAVATPQGQNVIFVGPSGCGKTTMAIALIRRGGRYLSDDAILLRARSGSIDALALRKPFSIEVANTGSYRDLLPNPVRTDPGVRRKQRADAYANYSSQHVPRFRPDVIVFPSVVARARSSLSPVSRPAALAGLLTQSGPELFDQPTMPSHLTVLTQLLRQATPYALAAGRDLHRHPEAILDLLQHAQGGTAWPGSSSS
jgi:hypothetical protein